MKNNFVQILSPLDQFEIRNLISLDAPILLNFHISLTNIGLYITFAATIAIIINVLAVNNDKVVFNNWSLSQETIYDTIHSIVVNQIINNL
jgi:F-type H+-transporting ATPase subunit a